MTLKTRELLLRLGGAVVGIGFLLAVFNDLGGGQYNWHGQAMRRTGEPIMFWIGTAFDAFAAFLGLVVAAFGSRGGGKH